jgi:hypothetical protein
MAWDFERWLPFVHNKGSSLCAALRKYTKYSGFLTLLMVALRQFVFLPMRLHRCTTVAFVLRIRFHRCTKRGKEVNAVFISKLAHNLTQPFTFRARNKY